MLKLLQVAEEEYEIMFPKIIFGYMWIVFESLFHHVELK